MSASVWAEAEERVQRGRGRVARGGAAACPLSRKLSAGLFGFSTDALVRRSLFCVVFSLQMEVADLSRDPPEFFCFRRSCARVSAR